MKKKILSITFHADTNCCDITWVGSNEQPGESSDPRLGELEDTILEYTERRGSDWNDMNQVHCLEHYVYHRARQAIPEVDKIEYQILKSE